LLSHADLDEPLGKGGLETDQVGVVAEVGAQHDDIWSLATERDEGVGEWRRPHHYFYSRNKGQYTEDSASMRNFPSNSRSPGI